MCFVVTLVGCGGGATNTDNDLGSGTEAARDLATLPPDLGALPADLSRAIIEDLSVTAPPDFAIVPVPDLRAIADLAAPSDLAAPTDLAAPRDLAAPTDLVAPPDLAAPADLATPPDMTMPPLSAWLLRVGDGATALTDSAAPLFLERHALPSGALLSTIALPTALVGKQQPITLSGTGTIEGALSVTHDGQYVFLAGYGAAPGTAKVAATAVARVVARVGANGQVDTSTTLTAFAGNVVSSAFSYSGAEAWVAGGAGGVQYVLFGQTSSALVLGVPANIRALTMWASNGGYGALYASASSNGTSAVFQVGDGPAPTNNQFVSATNLTGPPSGGMTSPYGLAMFQDTGIVNHGASPDRFYLADGRAGASNGGVQVWTQDMTMTWTKVTTFDTGTVGARTLAVSKSGHDYTVLAVATDGRVLLYRDSTVGTPSGTLLVSPSANTTYVGVTFGP